MQWLPRLFLQVVVFSPMAYVFPRFLVALGVPLDKWANDLGRAVEIPAINFNSVIWSFVLIFTLLMFWVEGRFNLTERLFYAVRPIRLSNTASDAFISLLENAQNLINEPSQFDVTVSDWQRRVVEWDLAVSNLIEQELPRKEFIGYISVNIPPVIGQEQRLTLEALRGRYNKLRRMIMRLLPPSFDLRPR